MHRNAARQVMMLDVSMIIFLSTSIYDNWDLCIMMHQGRSKCILPNDRIRDNSLPWTCRFPENLVTTDHQQSTYPSKHIQALHSEFMKILWVNVILGGFPRSISRKTPSFCLAGVNLKKKISRYLPLGMTEVSISSKWTLWKLPDGI